MTPGVLTKVIFDRRWLTMIYFIVTAITCIQVIFTRSFATGATAFVACVLCFVGPAGFIGSFLARRDKNSRLKELAGIAVLAVVLAVAGLALMHWSGFWINFFGVSIKGTYWAAAGIVIALVATRKTDVQ